MCSKPFRIICGGERDPVIFPAFKAGDAFLRGAGGGFDFHTPPPTIHLILTRAVSAISVDIFSTDLLAEQP
jgi:hypothetical protein